MLKVLINGMADSSSLIKKRQALRRLQEIQKVSKKKIARYDATIDIFHIAPFYVFFNGKRCSAVL
jgi:hypothetical protein